MAVVKVVPSSKPAPTKVAKVVKAAPALSLPSKPKEPDTDLGRYTLLLYGREKIGKTTMLSSFPDALFFSTEPGTKGLRIFEFNSEDGGVKNWDLFRKGVDLLIANPDRFKTIVVDTVDRAYDMCMDWVCENRGIEYPGHDADGGEDFGKSWRAVKLEFLEQIHRIIQSGRGLCFTSHVREETIRTRSGEKYTRIYPSMSKQARTVVEAIVDLFFYAEYIRDVSGENRRVLICQGDETVWAGARATSAEVFPTFLPMERDGYKVIREAFSGKEKGIPASQLLPSKSTSQTAKDFLVKQRAKEAKPSGNNRINTR
jgi:hypothetical protein